jgi:hypothetical protein
MIERFVVAAVGVIGYSLYVTGVYARAIYSRALQVAGLMVIAVYATFAPGRPGSLHPGAFLSPQLHDEPDYSA